MDSFSRSVVANLNGSQRSTADIQADGQVSSAWSYIHLKQTQENGYGIKEILYHNSSCFT